MKILQVGSENLTNYEVFKIVQEDINVVQEHQQNGESSVVDREVERQKTFARNVSEYIKHCYPAATRLDENSIKSFMESVAAFNLTDTEMLQILNLVPGDVIFLYGFLQRCDRRFTEEQVDQLCNMVKLHLLGIPVNISGPLTARDEEKNGDDGSLGMPVDVPVPLMARDVEKGRGAGSPGMPVDVPVPLMAPDVGKSSGGEDLPQSPDSASSTSRPQEALSSQRPAAAEQNFGEVVAPSVTPVSELAQEPVSSQRTPAAKHHLGEVVAPSVTPVSKLAQEAVSSQRPPAAKQKSDEAVAPSVTPVSKPASAPRRLKKRKLRAAIGSDAD